MNISHKTDWLYGLAGGAIFALFWIVGFQALGVALS